MGLNDRKKAFASFRLCFLSYRSVPTAFDISRVQTRFAFFYLSEQSEADGTQPDCRILRPRSGSHEEESLVYRPVTLTKLLNGRICRPPSVFRIPSTISGTATFGSISTKNAYNFEGKNSASENNFNHRNNCCSCGQTEMRERGRRVSARN